MMGVGRNFQAFKAGVAGEAIKGAEEKKYSKSVVATLLLTLTAIEVQAPGPTPETANLRNTGLQGDLLSYATGCRGKVASRCV